MLVHPARAAEKSPAIHQQLTSLLEQSIAVRSLAEQEQADWQVEKSVLEAQIGAWTQESERLTERQTSLVTQLETLPSNTEQPNNQISQLSGEIESALRTVESKLTALAPQIPPPLRTDLTPYLQRLAQPKGATIRSLDSRCRNIVFLFDRILEFDRQFSLHWETRDLPDGEKVLVQVLYLGMANAYFVDAGGTIAGTGHPSSQGWEWTFNPELIGPIEKAIAVQEKRSKPNSVVLPAKIR